MTIDIKALRALHEKATPGPWYGDWSIVNDDGDPIARTDVSLASDPDETDNDGPMIVAMRNALPALLDAYEERDRLRDWQEAVADGLGYLNRAEGQGGYEVAKPEVIANTYNRICAERDVICKAHNEVIDERDRLQGIVDDISSETGHCLLLDDEEHEAPALPDWVRALAAELEACKAKLADPRRVVIHETEVVATKDEIAALKAKLKAVVSLRAWIRPGSDAAPWVVDELDRALAAAKETS